MHTHILLETDATFNAKHLINFLKTLPHIKSVIVEPRKTSAALTAADWVRPGRPATDEEIDAMLDECEAQHAAGLGMPLEKARALTKKRVDEWKKKNIR